MRNYGMFLFLPLCSVIVLTISCKSDDQLNLDKDSDGDGILDRIEVDNSSDFNDPCDPPQSDEYDGYDLSNSIWYEADCDEDLASNGEEVTHGSNPYKKENYYPLAIGNYWRYEGASKLVDGQDTYDDDLDRFFYNTIEKESIITNEVIGKKIIDDKDYYEIKRTIKQIKHVVTRQYQNGDLVIIEPPLPEDEITMLYLRLGDGNTKLYNADNDIIQDFSKINDIERKTIFGITDEYRIYIEDDDPNVFRNYSKNSYFNTLGLVQSENVFLDQSSFNSLSSLVECKINGVVYQRSL